MTGFSRIYCITNDVSENSGSFKSINLQILSGDSNRQWYEAYYFDKSFTPIGKIKSMVPLGPNDENSLLDACIIFAPKYFESCPSLKEIQTELKDVTFLDFDTGKKIPKLWNSLRKEARPIFEKLNILKPVPLDVDKICLGQRYPDQQLIPLTVDQRYLDQRYPNSNYREQ